MCQFVETMTCENGQLRNVRYHEERFNRTRANFGLSRIDLVEFLKLQAFPAEGKYKVRIIYDEEILLVEYSVYQTPHLERIGIVEYDLIDYSYKYTDRDCFQLLYKTYPGYDDFLIVKSGLFTDSTFCNVAFLKDECWETPLIPLLEGTQRALLLEKGIIKKGNIELSCLADYSHISFFNALNEHAAHILPVSQCTYLGKFNPAV